MIFVRRLGNNSGPGLPGSDVRPDRRPLGILLGRRGSSGEAPPTGLGPWSLIQAIPEVAAGPGPLPSVPNERSAGGLWAGRAVVHTVAP